MRAVFWLRLAFWLSFMFLVVHSIGVMALPKTPADQLHLLASMQGMQFPANGIQNHWNLYYGLNLVLIVFLAVWSMLLWQLGELVMRQPRMIQPLIISLFLGASATAFVCWKYLFITPALSSSLGALCLLMAARQAARQRR